MTFQILSAFGGRWHRACSKTGCGTSRVQQLSSFLLPHRFNAQLSAWRDYTTLRKSNEKS
jgi:hypothetical protein